jgi:excisionase family DNA binding protein
VPGKRTKFRAPYSSLLAKPRLPLGHSEGLVLPLPFLTTAEVAKLLRVSQRTVCLWAELSELPAIKIGRQWRFRFEEVLSLVENAPPLRRVAAIASNSGLFSPNKI